jgi:hypothetical protein
MLLTIKDAKVVGSILHGAYGDYYEQMVCLRELKRLRPDIKLILFFETESRRKELAVFDFSFAAELYGPDAVAHIHVDRFVQFQILDGDLQRDIMAKLPDHVRGKFDEANNLKPWTVLRTLYRDRPAACDMPLSAEGQQRLPDCMRRNGVDAQLFERKFTVGFLWRHRKPGGPVSSFLQSTEETVLRTKSELLTRLINEYSATVLVGGMAVRTTDENRERTDCKFTEHQLDLPAESSIYLRGLSWGLELDIMRRCSLCIVMASGFSEALLMKRTDPTVLVDPPPMYFTKLWWNRMPLFNCLSPRNMVYYLRQPHTAARVMKHMTSSGVLARRAPAAAGIPALGSAAVS